jgi:hypothetical protein
MVVGRTSATAGSITIHVPVAAAAALDVTTEVTEPPQPRSNRWELAHRAGSIASIVSLVIEVASLLLLKRHAPRACSRGTRMPDSGHDYRQHRAGFSSVSSRERPPSGSPLTPADEGSSF